ncbi:HD-GYP domain-containing protein [Thalassotalea hakodatensis]|uniref:HD-GYP domain-containing protein n=1 Tax=Thalassotalea hakodatensis TaxID=3030492 RepID=UPI00257222CF|nr:HD domain-containing phosphohydrolase [Thalassotalea hakodatensis]
MLKTISINELKVGMHVEDIILKNSLHKVKNKGKVNSARTIELLKKQGVDKVTVDFPDEDLIKNSAIYNAQKQSSVTQELAISCQLYDDATAHVKQLFLATAKNKPINPTALQALADEITASVMRNEHAMTILTRIRNKSYYHYEHAINCAVLICGFSLHLGFKEKTVKEITLGALLHDIGSAKVPLPILEKPGELNNNERSVVQKHVYWGVELAKKDNFASPLIIDMLVNHHERLDGSGYPRGIDKNKLSKLSCITAIVDVYDAMTGKRHHKEGELPLSVLRYLLKHTDKFEQTLVEQFVKYLGVYPVGSLVRLSNDKLAVVLEANRLSPLKPKISIIYSVVLNKLIKPIERDLTTESFCIVSAVNPEKYKINMNKVIRNIAAQ